MEVQGEVFGTLVEGGSGKYSERPESGHGLLAQSVESSCC